MSQIMQAVVASLEEVAVDTINRVLPTLTRKSIDLKEDLLKYLEETHVKFVNRPTHLTNLLTRLDKLLKSAESVKLASNEIKTSIGTAKIEIDDYNNELTKSELRLKLVNHFSNIHEGFLKLQESKNKMCFVKRAEELICLQEHFDALNLDKSMKDVYGTLYSNLFREKSLIADDMKAVFETNFKFDLVDNGEKLVCDLSLKLKNNEMTDVLQALYIFHQKKEFQNEVEIGVLTNFIKVLWDNMIGNIINKSTVSIMESDENYNTYKLTVAKDRKDSYDLTFLRLIEFSDFLQSYFEYALTDDLSTMNYISRKISNDLSELIIKGCLEETIPSNEEGLQTYNEVIKATEILHKKLVKSGLFPEDATSLLDHAKNVDVLFINKMCQEYKKTVSELMKKDLHDCVTVGSVTNDFVSVTFPQCSVSKSVLELIKLIEKLMLKATKSSDVCAGRLYITAENILNCYGTLVQEHHEKLLQTIPQQIALFYNNCMYLCYEFTLEKWAMLYKKLPALVKKSLAPFAHLPDKLQLVATNKFQEYVETQTKEIETTIEESGILSLKTQKQLDPNIEKATRQCLRKQELLKTVWQKVLDNNLYDDTLGLLLDSLCSVLIRNILLPEDISSEAAEQLADIINLVLKRGPKLFSEPKEIHKYVKNWYKLTELLFVLQSNLENIDDRWADGKGPLALYFKPEELRWLVRALFQNTDRRSKLLAKIRGY